MPIADSAGTTTFVSRHGIIRTVSSDLLILLMDLLILLKALPILLKALLIPLKALPIRLDENGWHRRVCMAKARILPPWPVGFLALAVTLE